MEVKQNFKLIERKMDILTNFRVVCGVVTNKLNVTEYS